MTVGLLGVFGCVPSFDNYFCQGLKTDQSASASLRVKGLGAVGKYYAEHLAKIEALTLDLSMESDSSRRYPAAKIIDFRKEVERLQDRERRMLWDRGPTHPPRGADPGCGR
jgi:hypothetical protein